MQLPKNTQRRNRKEKKIMVIFKTRGNKLTAHYDAETLTAEPWGADSVRIRATCQSDFPPEDWALLPPAKTDSSIIITEDYAQLTNGNITVRISSAGRLSFYNQKGICFLEEFWRTRGDAAKEFCSALLVDGREFKPLTGGDYHLTVRFEAVPGEKIYGMGQYQQPYLNLAGCDLELAQRNSQSSVPFLISSLGYGMLWNNPAVGRVTFGKNVTTWEAQSTKAMDYWITAGDTPAQIEEAYARATGTVPMMPEYGMGFWQCKLRYRTQEEVLSVAREYKRRQIPISVIVIDYFHWTNQGDWKFDPEYWPDPEGMIRELEEMGIKLMVSVWPYVDYNSDNFEEMRQRGYLVRTESGLRVTFDILGKTVAFDATNPEAREYVWNIIRKNYYNKGIHIFWLDEAEPEYTVYDFDHYRYYRGSVLQVGNIYPVMYAKTFFEGMQKEGQNNIVNLLRCAWAGSQRYGALVWSGDIHSSYRSLRSQVRAGLNMGLAGIPWWTTDIGGFFGGTSALPEFRELLVRWFEYGTFCPVMRLHGQRLPITPPVSNHGGGMCKTGAGNEVWSFGDEAYEILVRYIRLRESMRPYIRTLMTQAHEKGTPVMRTLFYVFPDDPSAWEIDDEYLFGSQILVAPVLEANAKSRSVYLPSGTTWTNAWTGEEIPGGTTVEVKTPPEQIPLFTCGGYNLKLEEIFQ